jgi:hypothetical protein
MSIVGLSVSHEVWEVSLPRGGLHQLVAQGFAECPKNDNPDSFIPTVV